MTFVPYQSADKNFAIRWYPKTASTAFTRDTLVAWPGTQTGYFVAATATTTDHIGAILVAVASTDSDYANNTLKPVLVPTQGPSSEWRATTASAVATDAGGRFDLTDAATVNRGAEAVGAFVMTRFISATEIVGFLRNPTSTT